MGEEDILKINTAAIKGGFTKTLEFLKQKRVINIIIVLLFLALLIGGSWIRLQNLPLLKDSTTGEYIPLALDPFYFLRLAETIVAQGGLPEVDSMRYVPLELGFTPEILPQAIVLLHKIASIFNRDITIRYIDVISPVIFFILGFIVFFLLIWILTNSKTTALISSAFLAVIPTYLHRTLAGFADHEAIGMFSFFLVMLIYALALKFLEKKDEKGYLKTIGFGLLVAFLTSFSLASWGGIATFIFTIFPLSFGLIWLIRSQNLNIDNVNEKFLKYLIFYSIWIVFTILFTLIYGSSLSSIIKTVLLGSSSILTGAVFLFLIIDYILILKRGILNEKLKRFRILISILITAIIGTIFLALNGTNILSFIPEIINRLLQPFGASRTGLTVAENAQPYLLNWIGQTGKTFFWIFFIGIFFVGINIAKGIHKKGHKFLFSLTWIAMFSGILFSRISSSHLFNGVNFISKFIYFGGLILFGGYFMWLYFNERIRINNMLILISSWLLIVVITARGAIRIFFVITPLFCFMVGYAVVNLFSYARRNKEEILRMFLWLGFIIAVILLIFSFNNFSKTVTNQAKFTGPSAGLQWQNAMEWVRENTGERDIFVHWWDYGYWVQYLGERPTVTDGGHGNGFWDHLIGRYLLTTSNPETALSFMKAQNVSYLLIDPTDLGKYPAYSKIGSGSKGTDRVAQIPVMIMDPGQIQETADTKTIVYQGGISVDQDIIYDDGGGEIFLPSGRAGIGGIILEVKEGQNQVTFNQPKGIFIYNNQRYTIPLRYLYYRGEIFDFKQGLEATARIMPMLSQNAQGVQIERLGSLIYLSPKTMNSLFAQLYLMDDVFERYETVRLAHSESDPIMAILKSQGLDIEEPVYFQGFRGPIKIWKVDYPQNIIAREEFLRLDGEFAEFDNLEFIK